MAAPLPVTEAYKRGATKIVVIRTVDRGFQVQSPWLQKLSAVMCATGTCPKTIDYLLQHEQAYQKELAFIENPPESVEVIQIFASDKLQSKLLGSTDAQLRHDYKLGKQAGSAFLETENKVIAYQLEENRQPVASFFDVTDTPKGIHSKDSANYSVKSEHAALNGERPIKLPFPARRTGKIDKVDKENRISA